MLSIITYWSGFIGQPVKSVFFDAVLKGLSGQTQKRNGSARPSDHAAAQLKGFLDVQLFDFSQGYKPSGIA